MHSRIVCIVLIALVAMLAPAVLSQESSSAQTERLRKRVIEAGNCFHAVLAYDELFKHVGRERIIDLRKDADAGIALQAAYSVMRQGSYPDQMRHPSRFVGFIEGRLGVTVPEWWHAHLAAKILRDYPELGRFREPQLEEKSKLPSLEKSGLENYLVAAGTSIKRDGGRILLRKGKDEAQLTEDAFRPIAKFLGARRYPQLHFAIFSDFVIFVGADSIWPGPFPIWSVNRTTGDKNWDALLWVTGITGVSGPISQYTFDPVVGPKNDTLVVFGFSPTGANLIIEGFDLRNGKPAFRFSTDTWILGPGPRSLDTPPKR